MSFIVVHNNDSKIIQNGNQFVINENYIFKDTFLQILKDKNAQNIIKIRGENCKELIFFGDVIFKEKKVPDSLFWSYDLLAELKGNFVFLIIKEEEIIIGNSYFSLLPVYYSIFEGSIKVSDNFEELTGNTINVNRQYVLERLLFNYTLSNQTLDNKINILPINSVIILHQGNYTIYQHTDISNLYTDSPQKIENSKEELVDYCINSVKEYLPEEPYYTAFTSGFDGRCMVAAGMYHQKKFATYSFGTLEAEDILIPQKIANRLGVTFDPIILNEKYINDNYLSSALNMVKNSYGQSTISRAHYQYAALILQEKTRYIVSGNFGSELFRAAHLDGVMTSNVFYDWITGNMPLTLDALILKYPKYSFLRHSFFEDVYVELLQTVSKRRDLIDKKLPLGARLYYLLWEETIRNYFGSELTMQQNYLFHRSPFLDFNFFKVIQGTEFSGAYGGFKEKSLSKRLRGQLFYAHFLKKTNPVLYKSLTGKGYRPIDIISFAGKLNLIKGKLINKYKKPPIDPFCSSAPFNKHKQIFDTYIDNKLFNIDGNLLEEDVMKTITSFSYYLNHYKKNNY